LHGTNVEGEDGPETFGVVADLSLVRQLLFPFEVD
jgi:hypothetical protein